MDTVKVECRLVKTASSVVGAVLIAVVLVLVGGFQRSAPMPGAISLDHVVVDQGWYRVCVREGRRLGFC
jgi:hypothetical protein